MKYEKSGGEEAIRRTAKECEDEEIDRLHRVARPKVDISYLRLLPNLPDNPFMGHDEFTDGVPLGYGTEDPPIDRTA